MGIIFDKPLIGVVMCQKDTGGHPTQTVHNKYCDALVQAGGVPLALPHSLINAPHLLENAMAVLDGLLLTGSPSNIEPWHYGEAGEEPRLSADHLGHQPQNADVWHLPGTAGAGGGEWRQPVAGSQRPA